ncbi:MAG TPA: DUF6265 family protein [Longimicrobium sp.]|nr:DUF6265 family protein [Longimicrobium sp.]
MKRHRILPLVLLATALAAAPAASQGRAPLRTATLADVGWIAGRWGGEMDSGATQEWWSAPEGDNMLGMFRYVKDGKGVFYELMSIEQTADGPVLRLRHFSPRLVAWEEKDGATSWPLVELAANRAVFEMPDGRKRLVYHRTSERAMTITLEERENGAWKSQPFTFALEP